jgi:hypothetical protein
MTDSAYATGIADALSGRRTMFTTALDRLEDCSHLLADIAALLVEEKAALQVAPAATARGQLASITSRPLADCSTLPI